jgi:uncharacterized protein (TIGR02453 family)
VAESRYFSPATFRFLSDLARNNDRAWFQENKPRYEEHVREPAVRFIGDFAPRLRKISPQFRADPRPAGGSLFRIHRDTRFSRDKSPYKTHTGIQFRHLKGKDVHCPGFYLHLEPRRVFVGVGIWHPASDTLGRIRDAIVDDPKAWRRAVGGARFSRRFTLSGDSLKRPPRGCDPGHPEIEDLMRKDFIAVCPLSEKAATAPGFLAAFARVCGEGAPLVKYLCGAVGVPF